jgi:putative spermidine/putrescine transport system permease protein
VIFAVLIVAPFAGGIIYAGLYSFSIIGYLGNGFTLLHWNEVLTNSEVLKSFIYTLYIGCTSLVFSISISLLFIINSKQKQSNWFNYFIYLPLAIPAMVAAFFSFQFLSKAGLLSRIFYSTGISESIESFPDLVNDTFGLGIILTHVVMATPFFILLFQNYYHSQKLQTLKELAFTLGASQAQFNYQILIPVLLKKTIAPLGLYFIFMLGSYEIPLLLGTQSPQMISVLITRMLSRYNLADIPQGYIISILYTAMILLLLVIINLKNKSNAQQNL